MSTKPILFNTEMVKAILDGRKTVTRRICKDANDRTVPLNDFIDNEKRTYAIQSYSDIEHNYPSSLCEVSMPICKGDILYARETWCELCHVDENHTTHYDQSKYYYKTDGDYQIDLYDDNGFYLDDQKMKWHSSIHMPKVAARIFLRVKDVRVERLQDINGQRQPNDILREGIVVETNNSGLMYKAKFIELWNSTIKESDLDHYGWNGNPYVWVIEFEWISKEDADAERN